MMYDKEQYRRFLEGDWLDDGEQPVPAPGRFTKDPLRTPRGFVWGAFIASALWGAAILLWALS